MTTPELPMHVFRFTVLFRESPRRSSDAGSGDGGAAASGGSDATDTTGAGPEIARGAFSEVTGLEATMEPFAVSQGGRNRGQAQFVGRTTFSTVILKRGFTSTRHLWDWFHHVNKNRGAYAQRLDVVVQLQSAAGEPVVSWTLKRALPVKIKLPDLAAAGQEVGIEELHLVFEDMEETIGDEA